MAYVQVLDVDDEMQLTLVWKVRLNSGSHTFTNLRLVRS
jgi:hypothetical protein